MSDGLVIIGSRLVNGPIHHFVVHIDDHRCPPTHEQAFSIPPFGADLEIEHDDPAIGVATTAVSQE